MHSGGDLLMIELGAVVLGLAIVARLARRIGLPALPLYLLVGLGLGEGGLVDLPASADFIEVGAEIGVILMLLMLGLEFSTHELIANVRRSTLAGIVDLALNFPPGFVAGLLLGFDPIVAVLLGGVTYISSSGIVAKLVADLDRIGNHETPVILSVLVIEDLAMVLYLPIVSGVLFGGSVLSTTFTVSVSLLAVLAVLGAAYLLGDRLSAIALSQSSEALPADPARRHTSRRRRRRTPQPPRPPSEPSSSASRSQATSSRTPAGCCCRCATSSPQPSSCSSACKWTCNSSPMSPSPRSPSPPSPSPPRSPPAGSQPDEPPSANPAGRVREPHSSPTESSRLSSPNSASPARAA